MKMRGLRVGYAHGCTRLNMGSCSGPAHPSSQAASTPLGGSGSVKALALDFRKKQMKCFTLRHPGLNHLSKQAEWVHPAFPAFTRRWPESLSTRTGVCVLNQEQ